MQNIVSNTKSEMTEVIAKFEANLAKISTGRANPSMLDSVRVDYYGTPTPIDQMAAISVSEGRQLVIKPYDKTTLKDIDAAIRAADLGFNPGDEGDLLRINVPALTEETRKKFAKEASEKAENAKVGIRQARQSGNDAAKKSDEATEDDKKHLQSQIQDLTNEFNAKIDEMRKEKEAAIMTV